MRHLLLLCLMFPILGLLPAQGESDSGASHDLRLKYSLNENWFLVSRSGGASYEGDYFTGYTGLGIGYNLNDCWSVRAGYRHGWSKPLRDWLEERSPYIEAYYANEWQGFRVDNRSRFEFRYYDFDLDDDVRFRNEIIVEAPWELSPLKLKLYAEDEVFYGFNQGEVERNWLGGGLFWRPYEGVRLKLGYRWMRQRLGDEWFNFNVLVTGVNVSF